MEDRKNNGMLLLVGGIGLVVVMMGGLFLGGVFDDEPVVQVDRSGIEVDLPDEINIGKKKDK